MTQVAAQAETRRRRIRVLLRQILAVVLALVAALPMFGLIDLGTLVGLSDPAYRWAMPLEASWGAFFTVLVGGGFLWLAISRSGRGGVLQLGVAVVALVVAGAAAADAGPLVVALAVGASLLVLGLLDPALVRRRTGWAPGRTALVLAIAGAAVWLPYSIAALVAGRGGDDGDVTNGVSHWPVQAALGVALLLGAGLLAVTAATPLRVSIVLCALVVGVTDLVYPDRIGVTGPLWAGAAVVWALLIAVVPSATRRAAAAPAGTPRAAR